MSVRTEAHTKFTASDKFSSKVRNMGNSMGAFMNKTSMAAKTINRHFTVMNDKMNNLTSGFRRFVPALGLLSAGGAVLGAKNLVETAAEYEALAVSIKFASGSAEEGAKSMAFLKKMSRDMGIDFLSAADGFKQFSSSFLGTDVKMDEQRIMFENMSKAIRVMGLDSQKTGSVYYALKDIVSKGTVQSEELKRQLANALPGAMTDAAKSFKQSVADFMDDVQAGDVDGLDFIRKFTSFMGAKYGPGIKEASSTASAALARLSTDLFLLKAQWGEFIIDTGILNYISKIIKATHSWTMENKKLIKTKLNNFVDKLWNSFKWIVNNKDSILFAIKSIAGAFIILKSAMFLHSMKMAFTNPVFGAVTALAMLSGVLYDATVGLEGLREKVSSKGFSHGMEILSIAFGRLTTALGNLDIKSLKMFFDHMSTFILTTVNRFLALLTGLEKTTLGRYFMRNVRDLEGTAAKLEKDKIKQEKIEEAGGLPDAYTGAASTISPTGPVQSVLNISPKDIDFSGLDKNSTEKDSALTVLKQISSHLSEIKGRPTGITYKEASDIYGSISEGAPYSFPIKHE